MAKIRCKHDLEAMVALELGKTRREVRDVVTSFLSHALSALADREQVHLDGFGRFVLVESSKKSSLPILYDRPGKGKLTKKIPDKRHVILREFRVHFKKSDVFNRILREKYGPGHVRRRVMEKFGVDESTDQETLEKQASQGCPRCGSKRVTRHGSLLSCDNCGTEPWEKRKA